VRPRNDSSSSGSGEQMESQTWLGCSYMRSTKEELSTELPARQILGKLSCTTKIYNICCARDRKIVTAMTVLRYLKYEKNL
jgi:hypothetical protein